MTDTRITVKLDPELTDEVALDQTTLKKHSFSGRLSDKVEKIVLITVDVITIFFIVDLARLILRMRTAVNMPLILLAWLIVFLAYDLYESKITLSVLNQLYKLWPAVTAASILSLAFSVFFPVVELTTKLAVGIWLLALIIFPLVRAVVNFFIITLRSNGYLSRRTLIVGAGEVGNLFAEKIIRRTGLGMNLIGLVDSNPKQLLNLNRLGINIFTQESRLDELIKKHHVEQVIITFSTNSSKRSLAAIRRCAILPVRLYVVPRLFEILAIRAASDSIEGIPLMELNRVKIKGFNLLIKRLTDLIISILMALFLLLPGIIVALAIKLDSPGPVFFIQKRVGKNGKLFNFYKFRSMHVGAEEKQDEFEKYNELNGPMFMFKNDPRVTRVGRLIRRFSIDEFPQLINIFKGNMSLVGPRPQVPREVIYYKDWHKRRLSVKPGITGPWQVLGRNELPFEEMVKLDLSYIQNWSLCLDFKLMLQTVPAIISRRGAF